LWRLNVRVPGAAVGGIGGKLIAAAPHDTVAEQDASKRRWQRALPKASILQLANGCVFQMFHFVLDDYS
jgi:hypothetical protein